MSEVFRNYIKKMRNADNIEVISDEVSKIYEIGHRSPTNDD